MSESVDLQQAPRWRTFVRRMEPLSPGPLTAGSRVRVEMEVRGAESSFELIVLHCEPPALWRHRSAESDFEGYVEYRFEPEGQGTRVTFTMSARPKNLRGWLAMPAMLLPRGRTYREQLPQLKRALEGEGG